MSASRPVFGENPLTFYQFSVSQPRPDSVVSAFHHLENYDRSRSSSSNAPRFVADMNPAVLEGMKEDIAQFQLTTRLSTWLTQQGWKQQELIAISSLRSDEFLSALCDQAIAHENRMVLDLFPEPFLSELTRDVIKNRDAIKEMITVIEKKFEVFSQERRELRASPLAGIDTGDYGTVLEWLRERGWSESDYGDVGKAALCCGSATNKREQFVIALVHRAMELADHEVVLALPSSCSEIALAELDLFSVLNEELVDFLTLGKGFPSRMDQS